MPYLFCRKHGREHEASCQQRQEIFRQCGETVMIVSGKLISGAWQCDHCGVALKQGATAYLATAYPRHFAKDLAYYDYANERQYFQMGKVEVKVYGAMPPDGVAPP